jgi:chromatin remodeling complex protein RSC6
VNKDRAARFVSKDFTGVRVERVEDAGAPILKGRRALKLVRTGNLAKPVVPSNDLAAIVGAAPLSRTQVVSKVWDHIRKKNLQNPMNKREIVADDKLKKVFGGKERVSMFEMNKHLSNNLK